MLLGGINMYCKVCGTQNSEGEKICQKCGSSLSQISDAKGQINKLEYSGIFSRMIAYIIDLMLLGIAFYLVSLGVGRGSTYNIVILIIALLYFSIMEGSPLQGSFGKLIVKIKVTDTNGSRLPIWRTGIRYIGLRFFFIAQTIAKVQQGTPPAVNINDVNQVMKAFLTIPQILGFVGLVYSIAVILSMLYSREGQGFHDRLVKSYVINRNVHEKLYSEEVKKEFYQGKGDSMLNQNNAK